MKKIYFILFTGALFFSNIHLSSQVFGHPGATWIMYKPSYFQQCFEVYERWQYLADVDLNGEPAKLVLVTQKLRLPPAFPNYTTYSFSYYFKNEGDKVYWNYDNTQWQEIMDFDLQTGDTTYSPLLRNTLHSPWDCADTHGDSVLYFFPALVTDHGTDTISGVPLRYYTVQYRTSSGFNDDFSDTIYATTTYYERFATLSRWYEFDPYNCGATDACSSPYFLCYKDDGMTIDTACTNTAWFDVVAVEDEMDKGFSFYPNPAHDLLMVQNNSITPSFYQVISADGKLVLNNVQSPINIAHLPSGIYFLTDNNRTAYRKFIKN